MLVDTSDRRLALAAPVEGFVAGTLVFADDWLPLPKWAAYLTRLGAALASQPQDPGGRPTVALLVPTRGFAAVLCALGAVLQRLSAPPEAAAADRFALLSSLPTGTAVTYRSKGTGARFRGELLECDRDYVVVMPSTGSTIWIDKRFAHTVEVSGSVGGELPDQATSKAAPAPSALLAALLGQGAALSARSSSRLDCSIVGTQSALREEILDIRVGLSVPGREIVEGIFQELLQVRLFAGRSGVFHSDVLAAGGAVGDALWSDPPGVAVFDGAASFLKCGERWPSISRIIVLDRTDARSTDAAAEINREYVQRAAELALDIPELRPRGCEFLAYRARVR